MEIVDFIPVEIKELATKYGAVVEVIEEPTISSQKAFEYLKFARIRLKKGNESVEVNLMFNQKTMSAFNLESVNYRGYSYQEDDYREDLLRVVASIFEGRIYEKKSLFGRKKLVVTDEKGRKYWPRG